MTYDHEFYVRHSLGSRSSADRIAEIISGLIKTDRVVDVGCGIGTWLAAFKARGTASVLGLDGAYVDRSSLQIAQDEFSPRDLRQSLDVRDRFDLAISLEVAEHLPAERGPGLVRELVSAAPAVLFSAAIPRQGGTDHINERWQDYWAGLFVDQGYRVVDCVRPAVWSDPQVEPWYSQNILLYASPELEVDAPSGLPLRVVHPDVFLKQLDEPRPPRQLARIVDVSIRQAVRATLKR